ncbi:MAG: hypothetical protein GKR99_01210 [Rhodobacteraceae bacterium]|nr:hypothetical protein [Paracoccaceae bacterium]
MKENGARPPLAQQRADQNIDFFNSISTYRAVGGGVSETKATRRFHAYRQSLRSRRLNLRPPN